MNILRLAWSATALSFVVSALAPSPAAARKCPNVMFVIDKSGSMAQNPSGGGDPPTKWDLTRQAVSAAVDKYGSRIPFGLEMFSSNGNNAQQCYMDTAIQVPLKHNNGSLIRTVIYGQQPANATNTGEGIKRAYTDGGLNDPTRGNYIVLITDGDPNCNPGDNGKPAYTLSEITNATMLKPSVHTFVVGFDNSGGVDPAKLNSMALAGLEPVDGCNPNGKNMPCYYSASSQAAFLTAMDTIVSGLASTSVIGGCDDSCFGLGCPAGQLCKYPAPNQEAVCVPDPCLNLDCGDGAYCRSGVCVQVCPPCAAGTYCVAGTCQADKCDGATWNETLQYCDPVDKGVQPNKCNNSLNCPLPTFCDPSNGYCADDPCRTINCPAKSTCNSAGYCETDAPDLPDLATSSDGGAGADDGGTVNTRAPGCQVGGPASPFATFLPLAALLALAFFRRKR